ncbi:hypothetical protein LCGC14_2663920 [marine sediment metagenome]|uniref:Uncharacterized protein n=1 Tax=marine sediment metagenome TaxID=412755 RepID=A0A0F9CI08_9ZZZZ
MEKIHKLSWKNKISIKQIRVILNYRFRMGRENLQSIINEMDRMKLIKFKSPGIVYITWKPK